jgi:SAM-dependent methyltransferase
MSEISYCPICRSNGIIVKEEIDLSLLKNLYYRNYKIDIKLPDKGPLRYYYCKKCTLKFFDDVLVGDENFYNMLHNAMEDRYYQKTKKEYEVALNFINNQDSVLEIGAGKGEFGLKINNTTNYTGLELSQQAADLAEISGVKVICDSIQNFSKKHVESFDVVCFFQVLEHIPVGQLDSFLESSVRCLKQNGKLIISVPCTDSAFINLQINNILNMPPHHQTHWHTETFNKLAVRFNLRIIAVDYDQLGDDRKKFMLLSYLVRLLLIRQKLLYKSLYYKTINRILKTMINSSGEKTVNFLFRRALGEKKLYGHSVTCIFEK